MTIGPRKNGEQYVSDTPLHELSKHEALLRLLDDGMIFIQLDPTATGVDVPAKFHDQPVLGLNLSYAFHIPDFEVGEEVLICTLSFPEIGSHQCIVPLKAIFSAVSKVSGDGALWVDDMPPLARLDMAQRGHFQLASARQKGEGIILNAQSNAQDEADKEPGLRVITGGQDLPLASLSDEKGPDDSDDPPPTKKRNHLRLLK